MMSNEGIRCFPIFVDLTRSLSIPNRNSIPLTMICPETPSVLFTLVCQMLFGDNFLLHVHVNLISS